MLVEFRELEVDGRGPRRRFLLPVDGLASTVTSSLSVLVRDGLLGLRGHMTPEHPERE
jgi:hypothetical protein